MLLLFLQVTVPSTHTYYHCKIMKLAPLETKRHVYMVRVRVWISEFKNQDPWCFFLSFLNFISVWASDWECRPCPPHAALPLPLLCDPSVWKAVLHRQRRGRVLQCRGWMGTRGRGETKAIFWRGYVGVSCELLCFELVVPLNPASTGISASWQRGHSCRRGWQPHSLQAGNPLQ